MILPIPVPIPAPLFAVGYVAYEYWAGRQQRGRINHDAHLCGAVFGVLFVLVTEPSAFGRLLRLSVRGARSAREQALILRPRREREHQEHAELLESSKPPASRPAFAATLPAMSAPMPYAATSSMFESKSS
jgi:hypothetical protein